MERASDLLQAGLDAMRGAHARGLTLHMSYWSVYKGAPSDDVFGKGSFQKLKEGQICAVCAGGALALARNEAAFSYSKSYEWEKHIGAQERALDAFRCGNFYDFAELVFDGSGEDSFQCERRVRDALKPMDSIRFSGLISDPTDLFAQFEKAIDLLRDKGL